MFLIDIAVPRNIEPAIHDLDNVFLYDIDDLQEVVNANLRERMKEAERAEEIVVQEVERMMAHLRFRRSLPPSSACRRNWSASALAEIEKVRRKYGPSRASRRKPGKCSRAAS